MINRRQLLTTGVGVAAIGTGAAMLSGCTTTPPDDRSSGGSTAVLPRTSTTWPVSYDHPGSPDGIIAPFLYRYPSPPPVTSPTPPGDGSTITAMCQLNTPAPTPMAQNPVWQAINTALNATLDVQFTPGSGWAPKLQAILAGGNLPDILQITATPKLPDLLSRTFADLTEHLSGDAVSAYPNLALLGEAAWRNVTFDGRIGGIPQPRNRASGFPYRIRADVFESLGLDPKPTTGKELEDLMHQVTDPGAKRYASAGVPAALTAFATMFGAPNKWEVRDGALLSEYESEEYLSALDRVRTLWAQEVFHPESFSTPNAVTLFDNAQSVIEYGSFDALPRHAQGIATDPTYRAGFMVAPRYEGGGPARARLDSGYYGMAALPKTASPDRIRTLLKVLDWIAAPAGTAEFLLRQYGLEGRDHTIDADGILQQTPQAGSEIVILGYLSCPRPVYVPPSPELRPDYDRFYEALVAQYQDPRDNAANGYYVEAPSAAANWERRLADTANEIIKGNQPTSAWTDIVATWRAEVGDQLRDLITTARG